MDIGKGSACLKGVHIIQVETITKMSKGKYAGFYTNVNETDWVEVPINGNLPSWISGDLYRVWYGLVCHSNFY